MEFQEVYQKGHYSNSELITLIPKSLLDKCITPSQNKLVLVHESICLMHNYPKPEELSNFFKELNISRHVWSSLLSEEQKKQYIFKALDKNISEKLQKIRQQLNNSSLANCKPSSIPKTDKKRNSDFEWLQLPTKNQMLKPKLKTKLVQAINEYKNETKLRRVHGRILDQNEKVALEDDSFDLKVEDEIKMKYEWTRDDEQIFQKNVNILKEKFNKTEFLKNCQRYKFITNHELCTLASEEVSRKLDKSTKAFLSRQFLLDKYFSTKENLTEKQMKFILKTSPLLSKCVDKNFIKTAAKNIRYEDIDKMELEIAEDIIKKFESIRNVVKESRKDFKQRKNQRAKSSIKKFEEKTKYEMERVKGRDQLQKHQTKMMRKLNYKSPVHQSNQNSFSQTKKTTWPIPLNSMHPSTGLFIKDCVNEQINQDFNQYEKNYMDEFNKNKKPGPVSKTEMIKFYSGGPLENPYQQTATTDEQSLKLICETFKRFYYEKEINLKLQSLNLQELEVVVRKPVANFKTCKTIVETMVDITKRTKKSSNEEILETEKIIREKILEGKERSKNAHIIKKLLILAAENSFTTLKALNPRLPPSLINTYDQKGNTALFYAVKHKNIEFTEYLLSKKADVNYRCSKGLTPLHLAFKTNEYSLICKCLTGHISPNLNVLDDENRTPLFYCNRKILQMFRLENGVVQVEHRNCRFDNNELLQISRPHNQQNDELECAFEIRKKSLKDFQIDS